jgi:hypothetical protein
MPLSIISGLATKWTLSIDELKCPRWVIHVISSADADVRFSPESDQTAAPHLGARKRGPGGGRKNSYAVFTPSSAISLA